MIVDVDIGNNRIKWRLTTGCGEVSKGVCGSIQEFTVALSEYAISPLSVRVSCVGKSSQVDALNTWLDKQKLPRCRIAVAGACAGPVRSGYELPGQLGVDRWLAVCAAWQHFAGPVVVVDAGSALTIDFIDGDARHMGGYIVPGLAMARASLRSDTENVRFDDAPMLSMLPGVNTGQAVGDGLMRMFSALIERSVGDFNQRLGCDIQLVLTGGDAPLIARALEIPFVLEPDLVLQGLDLVMD